MASISSLQIILWIEIRVVENHRVSGNKVQTDTTWTQQEEKTLSLTKALFSSAVVTCFGAQEKYECVVIAVEIVDRQESFFATHGPIQTYSPDLSDNFYVFKTLSLTFVFIRLSIG